MDSQKRILILGGTGEAVKLARHLVAIPDVAVITSLAGRTQLPGRQFSASRSGGFGGIDGLVDFLRAKCITASIDVTHPFARQISFHAAAAAALVDIPHLMLVCPAWEPTGGDRWIEVESSAAAAAALPGIAQRIFLTIGRQELATFAHLQDFWFLMRAIDPPNPPLPPGEVLLARGPFTLAEERSLLELHQIEAIVSKNSGGEATYAKIAAARELGIPVVMVQRPPLPEGTKVADIDSALAWLSEL